MSRIAFPVNGKRRTTHLSAHFGTARWIMVLDTETKRTSFVRNTDQTGHSVVGLLAKNKCEDVVFQNIGTGAFRQLKQAGIGAWHATEDKTPLALARDLLAGRLRLARHATIELNSEHPSGKLQVNALKEQV